MEDERLHDHSTQMGTGSASQMWCHACSASARLRHVRRLFCVAPYRGGLLNRISRLVARLTHFGCGLSQVTPMFLLGGRRVAHEIQASVLVARAVPLASTLSSDCCGTLSFSGTLAERWTDAKGGPRFPRPIAVTATGILVRFVESLVLYFSLRLYSVSEFYCSCSTYTGRNLFLAVCLSPFVLLVTKDPR